MSCILIKGVAKAFSCQVEHNEDLVKLCKSWFKKDDINDPCFKLAQVPSKGILNRAHDKKTRKPMLYPIVSVENVFVFPGMFYHTQYTSETYLLNFFVAGIPELLERAFTNLADLLFVSDEKIFNKELFFESDEISLTASLNKIVNTHSSVSFGSYPTWTNQYYKTKVCL